MTQTANLQQPNIIRVNLKATRAQVEMIVNPAPIKVWVCGRRWGKTTAMKLALARMAINRPGSVSWFVSNTYAKALGEMRKMRKSEGFMRFVRRTVSQFPPRFEMKNGSEIAFRSLDNSDNLRGEGLNLIVHDEAAYSRERDYKDVLLPMIADTGGTYILGSTYNGKNWFHGVAESGLKGNDPDMKTWVYPTHTGIAFQGDVGRRRLAMLRRQYTSAVWAQEFDCEPLAIHNGAFQFIGKALVDYPPPAMPDKTKKYIAGIDIGRRVDHAAIVVMEVESGLITYVEQFQLGLEHTYIAARMKQLCEYWRASPCIDSTQPGNQERWVEIYKDILPNCYCVGQNRAVKYNMITNLDTEMELGRIQIPRAWDLLVSQLYDFQYKVPEGMQFPVYFCSPGNHDDLLSALYIAAWARKKGWEPDGRPQRAPAPPVGTIGHQFWKDRHKKRDNQGKL